MAHHQQGKIADIAPTIAIIICLIRIVFLRAIVICISQTVTVIVIIKITTIPLLGIVLAALGLSRKRKLPS